MATDLGPSSSSARQRIKVSTADRYALVGKTRSGKTFLTIALVCLVLLPWKYPETSPRTGKKASKPWQIWWVDTKGDPRDIRRLQQWGFWSASKAPKDWPRLLFQIRSLDRGDELSQARQVQALAWKAADRGNIILVIDEYVSVCMSTRTVGAGLKHVFQRGGGLRCGLVGGTQEPVGIPRQLVSQATHEFLLRVSFNYDVDWCNELCPQYGDGPPDPHGFWYRWIDGPLGSSHWEYYRDISDWIGRVINIPATTKHKEIVAA